MYGKTKGREDNREGLNVRPTSRRMQKATGRRQESKPTRSPYRQMSAQLGPK
ncbi:hypothetical protein HMPREF1991_01501 [Hoylesella loescheii DSM 19665 = JCM 12249 = ATCC 15930]|uniref:Uncharacterized protein n=1 Tax=Hoylesella loescheii DSM 19665 = JCM 12249 = ATCC 15930 TaxID=1122985 RepID=A0A069QK23_HOYLO|nr:hypothetical protein HMPREF1991_01501 [Hoylesella loescheii DSM 19665 = JCM 12249 = ATCC 15930]